MALDPQALHSNFATGKRAASEGLTEALSSITNMDRQGYNVGDSYKDAVRGYGSALSETFGQALTATTQQEQFDRTMSLQEQQRDDQHDADTLSGISSLIGMAGSVKSLLYGGDSLMDILSGTSTAKTVADTVSGLGLGSTASEIAFGEGLGSGATTLSEAATSKYATTGADSMAVLDTSVLGSETAATELGAEMTAAEIEASKQSSIAAMTDTTTTTALGASTAAEAAVAAELAATGYSAGSLAAGQSIGAAYGGGTIGAQSGAAMGAGTIAAGALGFAAVAYMAWSSYSKDEMGARNTSWLNAYYGDPHADDVSDLMEFYPDYITDEASAIEFAQAVMGEQPQFLDMLQQGVRGNTLANEPDTGYAADADEVGYDAPEWEEWQDFDEYRASANIWSQGRAKSYDVLAQGVGEGSPYSDEDLEEAMKNLGRSTEFDYMS